jgi:hypothetical protein
MTVISVYLSHIFGSFEVLLVWLESGAGRGRSRLSDQALAEALDGGSTSIDPGVVAGMRRRSLVAQEGGVPLPLSALHPPSVLPLPESVAGSGSGGVVGRALPPLLSAPQRVGGVGIVGGGIRGAGAGGGGGRGGGGGAADEDVVAPLRLGREAKGKGSADSVTEMLTGERSVTAARSPRTSGETSETRPGSPDSPPGCIVPSDEDNW